MRREATIGKALINLLIAAAVGYAIVVAIMYFAQRSLLYPGAAMSGAAPETAPWGEAVFIDTPDGERLYTLHSPAPSGRPTILFFHGNADRVMQYGFLAHELAAHDIGLMAVSYRGYTGSTGSPTEQGLLADGLAAFDWLDENSEGPVIPLGQSLGSGVAVHIAAERPQTGGIILVSAYDSVMAVAQSAYFFLPIRPLLKDSFRSDLRIDRVTQPKLFVHGQRDAVIPIARGRALFDLAPEPKNMLVYDAYGHNDIWGEGLIGDVVAFVETVAMDTDQ